MLGIDKVSQPQQSIVYIIVVTHQCGFDPPADAVMFAAPWEQWQKWYRSKTSRWIACPAIFETCGWRHLCRLPQRNPRRLWGRVSRMQTTNSCWWCVRLGGAWQPGMTKHHTKGMSTAAQGNHFLAEGQGSVVQYNHSNMMICRIRGECNVCVCENKRVEVCVCVNCYAQCIISLTLITHAQRLDPTLYYRTGIR